MMEIENILSSRGENMNKGLIAKASTTVNVSVIRVWDALTNPEIIKQYMFGTNVISNWKEGSPITYDGEYQGKKYHDKGVIKKVDPGKILQSTYWSSIGGKEDKPENYNLVTYKLSPKDDKTIVTLIQDNVNSEKEKEHVIDNWKSVLKKLKEVAEN